MGAAHPTRRKEYNIMVLLSDELYELMMKNIKDKGIREKVFEEQICISNDDKITLGSALETDINYWEDCIRRHSNEKECIVNHMRSYIKSAQRLMHIFTK